MHRSWRKAGDQGPSRHRSIKNTTTDGCFGCSALTTGQDVPVYNTNHTADGIPYRAWDTQYWSLWVTDSGGGIFKGLWIPSPYAAAGMYISNTVTEGRLYSEEKIKTCYVSADDRRYIVFR